MEEYAKSYIKSKESSVKPTSLNGYIWSYKTCIKDTPLGSMELSEIRSQSLQLHANALMEKYSVESVKKSITFIKSILNYAIKNEIIANRKYIVAYPSHSIKHSVFNEKEFKYAYKCCVEEETNFTAAAGTLLGMTCGLRKGEILGLKWGDIDFRRGTLKINRNLQSVKNLQTGSYELILQTPKTSSSIREVPLFKGVAEYFKKHRAPADFFVVRKMTHINNNINLPHNPREFSYGIKNWWKSKGIRNITIHELRHTYASRAITGGADVKTVSSLLGHKSADLTLNIYTHTSEKGKKDAVKGIEKKLVKPSSSSN